MKRILTCVSVFVFLLTMPSALFSKQTLSDDEMKATTAQEGVSIEFGGASYLQSHFVLPGQFSPNTQSWGDGDGCSTCSGYSSAGWVGTRNVTMDPSSAIYLYSTMNIDVGTSGGVTKTIVGLPAALIHPVSTNMTFALGTEQTLTDGQPALGTYYNDKFGVIVNTFQTGYMAIGNHSSTPGNEGIQIDFSSYALTPWGVRGLVVSLPSDAIIQSWGDANGDQSGATGYTSAGYFGAKGFTAADGGPGNYFHMLVTGTMTLDVGSDATKTGVIIGLPTLMIMPGNAINSPLALGSTKDFSDGQQLLGRSYMSGIAIGPSGSIGIFAH